MATVARSIRTNLGQFWPKRAIFQISLKNQSRHFFSIPETRLPAKNQKIPLRSFREKSEKLPFWAKKTNFALFFGKRDHFQIFGENAKTSLMYSFFSFSIRKRTGTNVHMEVNPNAHHSVERPKTIKFIFWKPVPQARQSQIWPNLGQIWVDLTKEGHFYFPQRSKNVIFSTPETGLTPPDGLQKLDNNLFFVYGFIRLLK